MAAVDHEATRTRTEESRHENRRRILTIVKARIANTHTAGINPFEFFVLKCLKICVGVLEDTRCDIVRGDVLEATRKLEKAAFATTENAASLAALTRALCTFESVFKLGSAMSGKEHEDTEHQFVFRVLDAYPFRTYVVNFKHLLNDIHYIEDGYRHDPPPDRDFARGAIPKEYARVAYVQCMVGLSHACEHTTRDKFLFFKKACESLTPPEIFAEANKHLAEAGYDMHPEDVLVKAAERE